MSNVTRLLKYAVAVILFCVAIGMALFVWRAGVENYNAGSSNFMGITSDISLEDLVQNANKQISGALVVTLAEKYRTTYPIVIATGEETGGFYDISYVRDKTSSQYVNPNKTFRLTIDRDKNDEPAALVFVQEGCSKPTYDIDDAAVYVHKSQMMYTLLNEERNLQENLEIYQEQIDAFAEVNYNVLVKNHEEQSKEYWVKQADLQKSLYELNKFDVD